MDLDSCFLVKCCNYLMFQKKNNTTNREKQALMLKNFQKNKSGFGECIMFLTQRMFERRTQELERRRYFGIDRKSVV